MKGKTLKIAAILIIVALLFTFQMVRKSEGYSNYTCQVDAHAYYQRRIGIDAGNKAADTLYGPLQDNIMFDIVMTIEKSLGLYERWIFT